MLSQVEAPRTQFAITNPNATQTPAAITATVVDGTPKTIAFSMPVVVPGVTASGNTVTTTPGTYVLNFTLANGTFAPTDDAITVTTSFGSVSFPAMTSTTASVNDDNTLGVFGPYNVTFNLTTGPIDPTIVNDPPQTV